MAPAGTSGDGPVRLYDLVLEVCRYFGWTESHVLQMPIHRFWRTLDHIRAKREEQADAARDNPLAALALLLGR